MKTLHTTTPNIAKNHGRIRAILAIVGIVIAVLCSIALLQDIHTAELSNKNATYIKDTSRVVASDLLVKAIVWL